MKKFFEKHDLIKIAFGMILLSLILTWIIPQGYFNAAELVKNDITRIGTFDFFTYGLLGMYYFTVLVTLLFVVGGFYQFLSKLGAYQKLTDSFAKRLKGKEILFSLIISFVFAGLASIVNEYFILIAFMPFIVTICTKLKMDKISTFVTTFGSLLVGMLGSTISTKIVGMNVQYLQVKYTDNLLEKILLFAIAFIFYSLFNVLYMKKTLINDNAKENNKKVSKKDSKKKADSKKETKKVIKETKELVLSEDLFANEIKDGEKSSIIPLLVVGILGVIVTILAYIPWTAVFNVDWFTKATEWVKSAQLFGKPVFSYILGNVNEFGSWDIFGVQLVMLLSVLILQICYRVSINTVIESFAEGFKKISKLVVILLLVYVVLEFAVMYPVLPTILDKILGAKFNVFTTALSGLVTSLFTCEYQYSINLVYSYFASAYASNLSVVSIILQSMFGLVSFFGPASAMLFVGLSYMEIPYKDWMKYIWKFIIAMLLVIIVMAFIIA